MGWAMRGNLVILQSSVGLDLFMGFLLRWASSWILAGMGHEWQLRNFHDARILFGIFLETDFIMCVENLYLVGLHHPLEHF